MDEDDRISSVLASLPNSGVTGESPGGLPDCEHESSSRDSQDIDAMCTDWTDEKHSLYLNSIEASFVSQLYNSEYCPSDLLGYQPITQKEKPSGSKPNTQSSGQFKVLREGSWGKHYLDKAGNGVDTENRTRFLCKNPWIQHFRSPVICRERQLTSLDKHGVIVSESERRVEESLSAKPFRVSCPQILSQHAIASAEGSDQNFSDTDTKEQLNASNRKKRTRSPTSPTNGGCT